MVCLRVIVLCYRITFLWFCNQGFCNQRGALFVPDPVVLLDDAVLDTCTLSLNTVHAQAMLISPFCHWSVIVVFVDSLLSSISNMLYNFWSVGYYKNSTEISQLPSKETSNLLVASLSECSSFNPFFFFLQN